ncbi:MAG: MFS transporter [Candidatus Lokiarchaeota archaeon]|nr:MFS transporter [Candidatus Lokiarchaeota archaeon]
MQKEKFENTRWIMASYGARECFSQWITSAFGFYTVIFYETVIGLNQVLAIVAFLIFSLWNAVNDPLLGFLIERFPTRLYKNKGFKRFPWVVAMALPLLLAYFSIYFVPFGWAQDPETYKWPIFAWYTISLLLFDTFFSIMDINSSSLFPEKFRSLNERRTSQGFGTLFGIAGIVLTFLITSMFLPDDTVTGTIEIMQHYRSVAWVSLIGGIFLFLLVIPGIWEHKKLRERNLEYLESLDRNKIERKPFFSTVKEMLSNKAFVMKIVLFFGYQASVALVNASALYVANYLLRDPGLLIFLLGGMLVGALLSTPLWVIISRKVNNNKLMSIIGAITMLVSYIPMIFVNDLVPWVIGLVVFGIGLSGQWFMSPPTMGDVIDDYTVRTGKKEASIFLGYQTFFIRFGEAFKVLTIMVVHLLTFFPPGEPTYTSLEAALTPDQLQIALFGIRIHTAIVPAVLVLITLILFWVLYPLTPDIVAENKKKLAEMGLSEHQ